VPHANLSPNPLARMASRYPRLVLWSALGMSAAAVSATTSFARTHALLINASPSLPYWAIWLTRDAAPKRGDLLVFMPPPSPLLTRHFGAMPALFGKRVIGVAGDRVTTSGREFFVNGHSVGVAKVVSRMGEPLAMGPIGVIPEGCTFVATENRDSFDSRYAAIGWICAPRILGVGRPVL
jgi:conjugal transfer pilin signal peptidase TrbI